MSLSGAACLRPLYFVECAKALLQPAGSSFSSGSVLSWTVRPHNRLIGRKADKEYLVGERCVTGHPFKRQQYSSSQHSCNLSCVIIQSRLREGGSENDDGSSNYHSLSRRGGTSKESPLLLNLIQEIQPLDVTQIGKEASSDSIDAMKRTISGMLGLLPSNQFQVTVETSREPITKLLVSSMMTGYTLRNAEYRLSLQKSLEASDDEDVTKGSNKEVAKQKNHFGEVESILDPILNEEESSFFTGKALEVIKSDMHPLVDDLNIVEPVGPLSKETKNYIDLLKRKLESISQILSSIACCHDDMKILVYTKIAGD